MRTLASKAKDFTDPSCETAADILEERRAALRRLYDDLDREEALEMVEAERRSRETVRTGE